MKIIQFKRLSLVLILLLGTWMAAFAQSQVSGTVVDAVGPLQGVTVVIKGTTRGTITDANGKYSLSASKGEIVQFSFIGYTTQEFPYQGSFINVTMTDDTKALDEVMVIGYGSVKKNDATGSVVAIKAEQMNKGLTTSASDMIAGKVAGVNIVTPGGEPGAGASIRIRGGSSLTASSDPLIVIDGIPTNSDGPAGLSNGLSSINPNDIASFTVLKDASATAIYGSRASNGVIIITTKKGVEGQDLKVQYNGNVSFSQNKKEIGVMNATQYKNYIADNLSTDPSYNDLSSKSGSSNTNWQDQIFRTAVSTDHNVTVLGSVKNMPYRASVGYTGVQGTLLGSSFGRFTGSLNLSPTFFQKDLKASINAKMGHVVADRTDNSSVSNALDMDPTHPVMEGSKYGGYYTWVDGQGLPNYNAPANPVALLNLKQDHSNVNTFLGNTQFDYQLRSLKDLHFNLNLGLDYANSNGINNTDPIAAMSYSVGGYHKEWSTKRVNSLFEFYSQYKKDLKNIDSKIDVMGGYSWQHFYESSYNSAIDQTDITTGKVTEVTPASYPKKEYYLVSFYGRLNYSFKDRYLLTVTMRNDGSSRFSGNHRWGLFPSTALAWKIKDEAFMKNATAVSDLKLRAGWGVTGQQNLGADYYYPSMALYTRGQGQAMYMMGVDSKGQPIWVNVIRPSTYNPDLKWESTATSNIGLDYGFLNDRISGSLDYYVRNTTDLLNAKVKVPAGANVGEYVVSNLGDLQNKGWEFAINAKPIVTDNFRWELGYNIAMNKMEITKLNNTTSDSPGRSYGWVGGDGGSNVKIDAVNNAPGAFFVYQQAYDKAGKPIDGVYVDQNGDGVIDGKDRVMYKKPSPDVTMGFNSKVTYKQWDFGFNGHASIGNYVYNETAARKADITMKSVYANSVPHNIALSALETNFHSMNLMSSYWVQNASYFKIDNVTLGYSFEKLFHNKISGRFYGSVQNVLRVTPYKGLDPEVTQSGDDAGIDRNQYPSPITFIFGVNLNL